jgi:hypothetical protein
MEMQSKSRQRGKDSRGNLELMGLISSKREVELMKRTGDDIIRCQNQGWRGQMTPFGIVGHWPMFRRGRRGGLWLWKKKWSDEPLG